MADEPIVIVDKDGTEHEFPAGFDPKRAAEIVRGQSYQSSAGMQDFTARSIANKAGYYVPPKKVTDELGNEVGGMAEGPAKNFVRNVVQNPLTQSTAYPTSVGDLLNSLAPADMAPGVRAAFNAIKGARQSLSAPAEAFLMNKLGLDPDAMNLRATKLRLQAAKSQTRQLALAKELEAAKPPEPAPVPPSFGGAYTPPTAPQPTGYAPTPAPTPPAGPVPFGGAHMPPTAPTPAAPLPSGPVPFGGAHMPPTAPTPAAPLPSGPVPFGGAHMPPTAPTPAAPLPSGPVPFGGAHMPPTAPTPAAPLPSGPVPFGGAHMPPTAPTSGWATDLAAHPDNWRVDPQLGATLSTAREVGATPAEVAQIQELLGKGSSVPPSWAALLKPPSPAQLANAEGLVARGRSLADAARQVSGGNQELGAQIMTALQAKK